MRVIVCLMLAAAMAASLSSEAAAKHSHGFGTPKVKKETPEDKLNCKQLSGRMQVRIMQFRGYGQQKQASGISHALQSVFVNTVGTSDKGLDAPGEHDADLKQLQDYNQRLVTLGCKSYNLEHELSPDTKDTPSANVPAPKKSKGQDKDKPKP
jgi:hypothetical protein